MTDDDIITGSWCSGSLLRKDQLSPHIEATKRILDWSEGRKTTDHDELEKARRELEDIERRQPSDLTDPYFEARESLEDLSTLDGILNQFAPDGYYWGSHEGDPTNVGYWRND